MCKKSLKTIDEQHIFFEKRGNMKNVVLSADGDRIVYSMPDEAADNLEKYCIEFDEWLHTSPHASEYRRGDVVFYNEADFIKYLNKWVFPNCHSKFVENLGWIDFEHKLPEKYRDCPKFNF